MVFLDVRTCTDRFANSNVTESDAWFTLPLKNEMMGKLGPNKTLDVFPTIASQETERLAAENR